MSKIIGSYTLALVKGLLTECPLDKPLDDCPAKGVRGLPLKERLERVAAMSESELHLIISHHRHCFQKRRWGLLLEDTDRPKDPEIILALPVEKYRHPRLDNEGAPALL